MTSSLRIQQNLQRNRMVFASTEAAFEVAFSRKIPVLKSIKKSEHFTKKYLSIGGDMLPKSKLFRVIGVFCLFLAMTVFAFGDTIRLKDGSIIKGKIISFGGGTFVVLIADGTRERQMTFTAAEVESIEFDNQAVPLSMIKTSNDRSYEKTPPTISKNGNNTVITVGSKNQSTASPTTATTDEDEVIDDTTVEDTTVATTPRNENVKPIQINFKVLADNTSNGWTNSGWVVKKGQKIKITSTGRVSLGNGRYASPVGISTLPDNEKLIKTQPTGGLIAVIGDDNNDFIYIGQTREFVAVRDGALFLGVNEGNLNDNSGAFDVTVEIDPTL